MLRCMYRAMDAQNPLRARNFQVVSERHAVACKSNAMLRPGKRRHPLAARAAMQIEAQNRFPAAHGLPGRRKNGGHRRIALKYRLKSLLDGNAKDEVRPELLQQSQGRGSQNTITQRAQTDDGDAGTLR